jgi:hypothetical protein
MSPLLHLKPCMSRSWLFSHDKSVLLSVVAQALLFYIYCVQVSSFPFRQCRWGLPVGDPDRWGLGFILGPIAGLTSRGRHSLLGQRECTWWERRIASTKLWVILWRDFWLQHFVNLNLMRNNYAFVCLCVCSLHLLVLLIFDCYR